MLTSIVSTLPASWQPYAKSYAAALLSGLVTLSAVLDSVPQWVTIVVALLSAPAVFATPNLDPNAEKQNESVQPPEGGLAAGFSEGVGDIADGIVGLPVDEEPKPQGGYWGGV
jgi:hypothetical protein